MANLTITDITAVDAYGLRTISGTVEGKRRSVSLPIAELENLTFEQSQERFVFELKRLLDAEPKPYPLPFSNITITY